MEVEQAADGNVLFGSKIQVRRHRLRNSKHSDLRFLQPVLNLFLDRLGAGGTCIVEPWHIYEHEAAVAYLRERKLDHLDLVRTRLQAVTDACVDSSGSVDELVQYSGANRF